MTSLGSLRHRVQALTFAPLAGVGVVPTPPWQLVGVDVEWVSALRWRLTLRTLPTPEGSVAPKHEIRAVSQPRLPLHGDVPSIQALGQRPSPPFVLGTPAWTAQPAGLTIEVALPATAEPTLTTDLYQVAVPVDGPSGARNWLIGLCILPMRPAMTDPETSPIAIDYLAKDYNSIRQALLDWISQTLPTWRDRDSADIGVMLVELLAYAADYLSYQQDAVATETYLATARLRRSVQRHARLLGYRGSDGVGSRVWVTFTVKAPVAIPQGISVVAGVDAPTVLTAESVAAETALAAGTVYQTLDPLGADPLLNELGIYAWGLSDYSLAAGAISCVLTGHEGVASKRLLRAGDILVFEQVLDAMTGSSFAVDPSRRHAVRILELEWIGNAGLAGQNFVPGEQAPSVIVFWDPADALPFDLPVVASSAPRGALSVAHGNTVLADLGRTVSGAAVKLTPDTIQRPWFSPTLSLPMNLVQHCAYDGGGARGKPAAEMFAYDPSNALPALSLIEHVPLKAFDGGPRAIASTRPWTACHDLLSSGPFDRAFVVEPGDDGAPTLRFGNGTNGGTPSFGSRFTGAARVAVHPNVNIGHNWISVVIWPQDGSDPAIEKVTNLLPAAGGSIPDTLEQIRTAAPAVNRKLMSCATLGDYVRAAENVGGVLEAAATIGWAGAWPAVTIGVRRPGGVPVDRSFRDYVASALEPSRLSGRVMVVAGPSFVPIDARLAITLRSDVNTDAVRAALLAALGTRGLFAPDDWGFGRPLYGSELLQATRAVSGVLDVRLHDLRRADWPIRSEPPLQQLPERAAILVGSMEVIQTEVAFTRSPVARGGLVLLELVEAGR